MSRCPNPSCRRESWQEHVPGCRGRVPPEHAAEHVARQLIVGLKLRVTELEATIRSTRELLARAYDDDVYVRAARAALDGPVVRDSKDCGSTIGGSVTWCCEKHANEDGEGLVKPREQAVLDAMGAFTEDELRESVAASRNAPPDWPKLRECKLSEAVCSAELRRRGLEP